MGRNFENIKKEVLRTIISAAALYQSNLLDTNILFVFEVEGRVYQALQTEFHAHHFAHLTGAVLAPPEGFQPKRPPLTPVQFFEKATTHTLSIDDFWMASNNSTYLKSLVIVELMKIYNLYENRQILPLHIQYIQTQTQLNMGFFAPAGRLHAALLFCVGPGAPSKVPSPPFLFVQTWNPELFPGLVFQL